MSSKYAVVFVATSVFMMTLT